MFKNLPPAPGYFVTGTDTGVGKTTITCQLLDHFNQKDQPAVGFKPIASGSEQTHDGLRNEDGLLLQAHSYQTPAYDLINPIAFEPAIAPHIAAQQAGLTLSTETCLTNLTRLQSAYPNTTIIVEGAGGWLTPLNDRQTFADIAVAMGFPVILVVGMQLGCLNHALLTTQAIIASGLPFAGWIANTAGEKMAVYDENLATLITSLPTNSLT